MSKLLSGRDLHKYLYTKLVNKDRVTCPAVSEVGSFTSLEQILDNLKSGYDVLKKQYSVSLSASLAYGEWLVVVFELHSIDKLAGKTDTWKDWLEAKVGNQGSYARKLREIAKLLGKYPCFSKLGLSFSEVCQRRKQIQSTLITDSIVAQYW